MNTVIYCWFHDKTDFYWYFLSLFSFSVFLSSGIELSSKASIVDPVDFISNYDPDGFTKKTSSLFIGRNNTEIWAHAGSNVVFDCLVGRPDLKKHAPVSTFCHFFMKGLNCLLDLTLNLHFFLPIRLFFDKIRQTHMCTSLVFIQ